MSAAATSFRILAAALALAAAAAPRAAPAQGLPPAAAEAPMGATVLGQGAARYVTFRVWAPNASKVGVCGDFNSWKPDALQRDPNRPGHWMLESRRAKPGDAYQFDIDGLRRRDPRGRAVSTGENKSYIVDPRETQWGPVDTWKMPPKEDLVMYEMHLGTFAYDIPGNSTLFERALKRLPYLRRWASTASSSCR